jgi:hypothetical protein
MTRTMCVMGCAMSEKTSDYSEQEAQQRFVAAVKAALKTPPQPMKDVPRKWSRAQRKQRKKSKLAAA